MPHALPTEGKGPPSRHIHGDWGNQHQVEERFDWREHEPIPSAALFSAKGRCSAADPWLSNTCHRTAATIEVDNQGQSAVFLFLSADVPSRCLFQIPVSSSSMTLPRALHIH
jgi:hypothetical protein